MVPNIMQLTDAQRATIIAWARSHTRDSSCHPVRQRAKNEAKLYSDVDLALEMMEGPDRDQRADYFTIEGKIGRSILRPTPF
jgi:hypothetical protein